MAWNDPSPRVHSMPASKLPSAQPGYGDAPVSFGRLVFRVALTGVAGVLACVAAKAGLAAWHGIAAPASALDTVLAVAAGFVVAALAWKYLMNWPVPYGLSARVRDGSGWGWNRGSWGNTVDNIIVADAAVDLIEVAIDIVTDL
jgi:hypothetical protein